MVYCHLNPGLRNSWRVNILRNNILKFIRPKLNSIFYCHNPKGIKLKTRLRLGLRHLCKHRFKHGFQNCLNPICTCRDDIEMTVYQNFCNMLVDLSDLSDHAEIRMTQLHYRSRMQSPKKSNCCNFD